MKLRYFVTILSLATLQGSVGTQGSEVKWIVLNHAIKQSILRLHAKFDENLYAVLKLGL